MPAKRRFSEEIEQQIIQSFHTEELCASVGKKFNCDFNKTIKPRWINAFGHNAVHSRMCESYSRSKTGIKNPMSGKCGNSHHNYKDVMYSTQGYKLVAAPDWYTGATYKSNHVGEHTIIALQAAGKTELAPGEIVHHKNHKKSDNSPSNLEIMSRGKHAAHHRWRTGTGKLRKGATTRSKDRRKSMKDSEAHSSRKADDIV